MIGLRSSAVFAVGLWVCMVFGLAAGANIGYTVDSPQNAAASYNGTHMEFGNETTNVTINFNETEKTAFQKRLDSVTPDIQTPADPYVQAGARSLARSVAGLAFTLTVVSADVAAGFIYHNQWLPKPLVSGFLQLIGIAPIVGLGVLQIAKVARYWQ